MNKNVDDKPSRATARALKEGNVRQAARARDGILRYLGVVLRLSRRNVSEVRPQLYRLRTLHAHTGEQAAHTADLETFFDVLRPHDDELGCMDMLFEHLVGSSQQDASHRGDYMSGGYENKTVNMYEVLALLTIVRHGSLQKKLQILHELFETSQYCKAGLYFQQDVYHPSQLLGNQPLAEDEVAFMIVSISRAISLSGISTAVSFKQVQRSVAGAVDALGGAHYDEGDRKSSQVTGAQLMMWAQTDPAPLALQEMLAMAPRLERMLKRFDGLLRTAEHHTGHLDATPMRSKGHGDHEGTRLTSIEARVSVGPVALHCTETSATIILQTEASCVLTCRVRPLHRPPPGPPPEMKDDITNEVESEMDDKSLGSMDSHQIGSQWAAGGEQSQEDAEHSMFELSTLQTGQPSVEETFRTGAYSPPAESKSATGATSLESPSLQQHSSIISGSSTMESVAEGTFFEGDGDSHAIREPTLEHDAIDIEQSCRAGETAIFTVPGLEPHKKYLAHFLQKDSLGSEPCIAVLPFSTTRPVALPTDNDAEAASKAHEESKSAPAPLIDDEATPIPRLAIEYGMRRRSRPLCPPSSVAPANAEPPPLAVPLGYGIGLKRAVKKWLRVLQRCADCSVYLPPMERREIFEAARRGAMSDLHRVAMDTLLDSRPNGAQNPSASEKRAHCHLSLSLVPQIRHVMPETASVVGALVLNQIQGLLNIVYEEVWLAMRGGYNTSASTPTLRDLTSFTAGSDYVLVPAVDWHADLGGSRSGGKTKQSGSRSQSSMPAGASTSTSSSRLSAWSRRQAYLSELEALLETLTPERVGARCCLVLLAPRPIIPADMHTSPPDGAAASHSAAAAADYSTSSGAATSQPGSGDGTKFTSEIGPNGQSLIIGTASPTRPALARARPLPTSTFKKFDDDDEDQEEVPSRHAKGFQLLESDDRNPGRSAAEEAEEKAKAGASNLEQIAYLKEAPQRAAEAAAKLEEQSLENLLNKLAAWRTGHTGREVVLLCGGSDNSVVSRAKNSLTGEVIVQHTLGVVQQSGRRGKKRALPERSELGVFQVEHKATTVQAAQKAEEEKDAAVEESASEEVPQVGDTLLVIPKGIGESMAVSVESEASLLVLQAKEEAAAEKAAAKAAKAAAKAANASDEGISKEEGGDSGDQKALDKMPEPKLPVIRVGPVVGKVTDRSAVILVETDKACTITAIAIDCVSGARHRCTCQFEVGCAHTFRLDGMASDRPHLVFFDGIDSPEDEEFCASFRTLDSKPTALNLHVLFREKFEASQADNLSYWEWLDEDARSSRSRASINLMFIADIISDTTLSEVQTMVHLFMKDEDADDHAQFLRAKDWLREKFALALSEPRLRRVLAHAPTLMMPGCWRLNNKIMQEYGSQCGCILEAMFDDVVSEFQAQLWGQSDPRMARHTYMDPLATDEHDFVPPMLNAHQRFFRHGSTGILTLTCMPNEPQMKNQHHHGAHICNEVFVYRFGVDQLTMLRTLLIETLRDHESDPTGRESKALDSINLLVIACELPVLTNSEAYHCDNKEVHVLLTILFGWKRRKPKQRRFVFVCAGGVATGETHIFDAQSSLYDSQLILPPMNISSSAMAEAAAKERPKIDGINDNFRWVFKPFEEGVDHGFTALSLVSNPAIPVYPSVSKLIMSTSLPPAVALFGPLIGEVSQTGVRILLEVETTSPVDLTCTVKSTKDGKEHTLTRVALTNIPLFYEFDELEPEINYEVSFSPLRDATSHTGWFRTMSYQPIAMRLCFVTGSDPLGQLGMSNSPVEYPESEFLKQTMTPQSVHHPHLVKSSIDAVGIEVLERQFAWNDIFQRSDIPERAHDVVVHLGGYLRSDTMRGAALNDDEMQGNGIASALARASQAASNKQPGTQVSPFAGLGGSSVLKIVEKGGDELIQRLRDAFRCAYGALGYRDMVRGGSHLLFMHDDEVDALMRYCAGSMQSVPAITRHMKFTLDEYKGRLAEETYLKPAKDDAGGTEKKDDEENEEREEVETPTAGDMGPSPVSYHQRGAIGILSISFTASDKSDQWTCGNAVLKCLERVLRKKELTAVFVCSHIPLVPQTMQFIETIREGGETKEQPSIPFSAVEPATLIAIFEQLFDWMGNTRQDDNSFKKHACIVAGTFQSGCVTKLRDNDTGAIITQLCTGRPRASVSKAMELVPYGSISERFSYTHSLPLDMNKLTPDSWPYAEVQVLTEPSKSVLQPSLCPTREQATGLHIVVGPIVGPLTEDMGSNREPGTGLELQPGGPTTSEEASFSVSVLVEFNQDATIECTLSEVFTHEIITNSVDLKAGQPYAFRLKGLGGERRFKVSFRGKAPYMTSLEVIESAETVFMTPAPTEPEFTCALVSGDDVSLLGTHREKNPWENLVEYGEAYIPRVNLVVHLGGQVGDLQPVVYEMLAYLRKRKPVEDAAAAAEATSEAPSLEQQMTDACVRERFRRAYREAWNMPTKKKVLRGNQHLMLCGELDIFKFHSEMERLCGNLGKTPSEAEKLAMLKRLSRVARTVQHEYQRQLWDENWATVQPVPNEATFQLFRRNQVGLFFFDVHEENPEGQIFTGAGDIVPKTEEEEKAEGEAKANEIPPPPTWEVQTRESGWAPYKAGTEQERIETDYAKGAETSWVDGENFVSYTLNFKTMLETKDKSNDSPRKIRRNDNGWAARQAAAAHAEVSGGDPFAPRMHTVSDEQWAQLKNAMDTPDMIVLIVASEVPFIWESNESIVDEQLRESAARQALGEDQTEFPDQPATEDSDKYCKAAWMYAPDQTKRLLKTLFEWKEKLPGREVVLAGGVGRGAYGGTDTTLTRWPEDGMLPQTMQQLAVGPITASPDDCAVPVESGKIFENIEFAHVQQQQRNYGIVSVQVGSDKYGAMCRVEGRILPFKAGSKSFRPRNDLLVPNWLKTRFPGDQVVYIEDEIWLRAKEDEGCNGVETHVEEPDFAAACRELYREFHLDDFPRPDNLRFIDMSNPVTLRVFLIRACKKLWTLLPFHVQAAASDLSDSYVLEMLFKKVMRSTAIFADADAFAAFGKELVYTSCILRLASLQTVTIEADEPEPVESDNEVEMEDEGVGPDGAPLSPMTDGGGTFPDADGMSVLTGEGGGGEEGGKGGGDDDDDSDKEKDEPKVAKPSAAALEALQAQQALEAAEAERLREEAEAEARRLLEEQYAAEAAAAEAEAMSPLGDEVPEGALEEPKEYDSDGNEIDPNQNLMAEEMDRLEDEDEEEHARRMEDPYTIAAIKYPQEYRAQTRLAKRKDDFAAIVARQKKQPVKLKQWSYDRLIDPTLSDDDDMDEEDDGDGGKKKKKKKKKDKKKKKKKKGGDGDGEEGGEDAEEGGGGEVGE